MPWVGFEPTISADERPKTYALDRAATGTGLVVIDSYLLHFSPLLLRVCGLSELRQYDQKATRKWQPIKVKVR